MNDKRHKVDPTTLSMPPDLRLHSVASQLRDWIGETRYESRDRVPPVELGYADDASWLKVGECCVWESENGGEIGDLDQEFRTLSFENAVKAYRL